MLDQLIRYWPIVQVIRELDAFDILEVGSGTVGLSRYLERSLIACDYSFINHDDTRAKLNPRLIPVSAKAEELPFKDRAFDVVVCVDTLEHVKPGMRATALTEICRVASRAAIIAVPCGDYALDIDRRLAAYLESKGLDKPCWLSEHLELGLPRESEVLRTLELLGQRFIVKRNENAAIHYLVMVLQFRPKIATLLNGIVDVVGRQTWDRRFHSRRANTLRMVIRPLLRALPLADLGPTYRTIFVVLKQAGASSNGRVRGVRPTP